MSLISHSKWMAAALAAGFLLPAAASAAPVTFSATGSITGLSDANGVLPGILPGSVSFGDSFVFDFTFDDTATDLFGWDPATGQYRDGISMFEVTLGGATFAFNPTSLRNLVVINDEFNAGSEQIRDRFEVTGRTESVVDDTTIEVFLWLRNFVDSTSPGTIGPLTSIALPSSPPDSDGFLTTREFRFEAATSEGTGVVIAQIDTMDLVPPPVPVPAALPLFVSALAGIGFAGWRKRRRAAVPRP